jgi:hypothetical protein
MATIVTRAGKGSSLTWEEGDANFTNLNDDKIEAVADDTAPVLGGDLDVSTFAITTTEEDGDIVIRADGEGAVLLDTEVISIGQGTAPAFITTPDNSSSLELNTNGNSNNARIVINPGTDGDIELTPAGTGTVSIAGLTYPTADGTIGQVLTTDGSGLLSFTTVSSGGIQSVEDDTAPILGGDLDVSTYSIVSSDDGDITVAPDGEGITKIQSDLLVGYGTEEATISSSGAHDLVLVTNEGTNSGSIRIVDAANGNIVLAPNGTGRTTTNRLNYNEAVHSLGTTSGTITPNAVNGNVQTITLNGNLTLNAFSSPVAGQSITLIVNTNGTNRTLTSSMKFAGGTKTLSTTNTTDIITMFYDGTNYWASLGKDFK